MTRRFLGRLSAFFPFRWCTTSLGFSLRPKRFSALSRCSITYPPFGFVWWSGIQSKTYPFDESLRPPLEDFRVFAVTFAAQCFPQNRWSSLCLGLKVFLHSSHFFAG